MPDFVKGFFHIHEHGHTFVSSIFGLCGYLKEFVVGAFVFPKSCLFFV